MEGCKKLGVSVTELRSGGRRGVTAQVRAEIARRLVEDYGLTLAEVARQVGILDVWSVEVVEPSCQFNQLRPIDSPGAG